MFPLVCPGPIILILISLFTISNGFCGAKSISVEAVLQKHKAKEDILLVDVRNSQEFKKFHIPGSMNIPLFALKTKGSLKSKPLVLINEGRSYKDLIAEGSTLSRAGFTVSILEGGLWQWQQKKGPIEGGPLGRQENPPDLPSGIVCRDEI